MFKKRPITPYVQFGFILCLATSLQFCGFNQNAASTSPGDGFIHQLADGSLNDTKPSKLLECTSEQIISVLNLTSHPSGLPVISADSNECLELAPAGDERCQQLADQAGYNASLSFFLQGDPQHPEYCGCVCQEDELFIPTDEASRSCASTLAHKAQEQQISNYGITNSGILLFEILGPNQDDPYSKDRCESLSTLFGMNLTRVLVTINETNFVGCQCSDRSGECGTDVEADLAYAYNGFGQGTVSDPYRIYTPRQLRDISMNVAALSANFKLCQDIELAYSKDFRYFSIGDNGHPFTGSFNGNDHAILGYTFDEFGPYMPTLPITAIDVPGVTLRNSLQLIGLFGKAETATIEKLTMKTVNITLAKAHYVGSLLGEGENNMAIQQISVDGSILVGNHSYGVGGLVGGFHGMGDGLIASVHITSGVGASETGGLVGHLYEGEITNSHATGAVMGNINSGIYVGGFAGINFATISNSYATGSVSGAENVGGFVGHTNASSVMNNVYATGDVLGANKTGGLVGYSYGGMITHVHATGNVSGFDLVAGLVGRNEATINNAYATGDVSGVDKVGGLVAFNKDSIANAYATGDVSGVNAVGGLVGHNTQNITNAYATGDVSGVDRIGGLIGDNNGNLYDSFVSQTNIQGVTYVGLIVGNSGGLIANNRFWSGVQCTGTPCTADGIGQADQSYFYNSNNAPLNTWSAPWIFSGTDYPTLP